MLKILRLFLLPFNLPYYLVTFVRNKCYDWGVFKSYQFDIPIICIGNLAVGGSGKTPTTEYIANLLKDDYKIAILSRGYGRKTKGYIKADENATAWHIGDEPLQYFNKLKNVTVAVCENRVEGVKRLIKNHEVILLDDAFQHRRLKAGLSILLFEQAKLTRKQWLMPAGNLRETLDGTKRADIILITKSDEKMSKKQQMQSVQSLPVNPLQTIVFSHIHYQELRPLQSETSQQLINENFTIFLWCGIANPQPLIQYLEKQFLKVNVFDFPDHHQFTLSEIKKLKSAFEKDNTINKIIITTEKDKQRLYNAEFRELLLNLPIYFLPITFELNEGDKKVFDQNILDYVASFRRFD